MKAASFFLVVMKVTSPFMKVTAFNIRKYQNNIKIILL